MKRALPPLAALSLCILLSALGTSIANVALPTIAEAFDASIRQVQWIVLAYLLAITTMIVSVGRLADLAGRRRMLLGGLALFIAASIVCGVAPNLGTLIAARAAQGLGAAAMMALAMPFVAETVAKEKSGSAMGLLGTTSAIGTAMGPSLGGLLIAELGWRAVFLAPVPLALLAMLLAWHTLPADRDLPQQRERFDVAGALLLAATLAAYALAMSGHRSLLLAAVAGLAAFVRIEAKAASPLLRLDLFSDRARTAAFATNALVTTVVMATLVVGPFYLAGALALDAARMGLVLSAGPVIAALAGMPSGAMVDRFGARRTTIAALATMAIGCAVLSQMPARFGIPGYLAPLVTITAAYALFQAANNTAVMTAVRTDQRGVISALLNLSRNLGLITGASLMSAIFGAAASAASGLRVTFAVAAALVAVALAIAYGVPKMARVQWSTVPR
jgi:EmrB/QacA subfamily drug resistance transporter